jgi:hypothetical protein
MGLAGGHRFSRRVAYTFAICANVGAPHRRKYDEAFHVGLTS